jgi:hypothetical protein
MTTLRVLLTDAPDAARADAWAVFGLDGRVLQEGRGSPSQWPRTDRAEAVLAAERCRLIELALPPLTADRLPAAVEYALEDQLAAADDPPRVAAGAQRVDGRVSVAVAARELIDAIAASDAFACIVPETALVPASGDWTLYASGAGQGFVRTPAGAFAVTLDSEALPAELEAALAQARRSGAAPEAVRVAFGCDDARLVRYAEAAGVPFVPVPAWRWTAAPPERYSTAPDWLAPQAASTAAKHAVRAAWFRPALVLASAALVLHVGATLVQWAALHWGTWRAGREIVALAQSAGLADTTTPGAAAAALVRHYTDARHRAGLAAPGDALPLLAQATPGLARLPAGALKSAVYGDAAWTIELAKVDPAALAQMDRALSQRGIAVLQAPTAAGVRMRITSTP